MGTTALLMTMNVKTILVSAATTPSARTHLVAMPAAVLKDSHGTATPISVKVKNSNLGALLSENM